MWEPSNSKKLGKYLSQNAGNGQEYILINRNLHFDLLAPLKDHKIGLNNYNGFLLI